MKKDRLDIETSAQIIFHLHAEFDHDIEDGLKDFVIGADLDPEQEKELRQAVEKLIAEHEEKLKENG